MNGEEGERKFVEVRARTVDEAVARGLVRLGGLSRSEVTIEVVSEGRAGLLGFGAEEAVVRLVTRLPGDQPAGEPPAETPRRGGRPSPAPEAEPGTPPPAPRRRAPKAEPEPKPAADVPEIGGEEEGTDTSHRRSDREAREVDAAAESTAEPETVAEGYTIELLHLLGYEDAAIEVDPPLLPIEVEEEPSLVLGIRGTGVDRLLSREARPLLALQFLVRLAVNHRTDRWVNLLLDVNGDRARRVKELFHLAEQSAELVDREGRPVSLPPMTPYERRVVHLALRDHPTVVTQSIGKGDFRKVTVRLKGQLLSGV